jgi:cytochrome oxidase Cu insertion factor (SCO1/SenC/PrrC family)
MNLFCSVDRFVEEVTYIRATHENGIPMRPLYLAALLSAAPGILAAQKAAPAAPPLEIGAVAPDFTMKGATRYGVLGQPVHLSDFRGKTVVLAFFYKARTSG